MPIVTAVPSLVVAAPLGNEYFFLPILLDSRGLADMIGWFFANMFTIVLGGGYSAPSIRLCDRSGCSAMLAIRPIRILGKLILELLMLEVVETGM